MGFFGTAKTREMMLQARWPVGRLFGEGCGLRRKKQGGVRVIDI